MKTLYVSRPLLNAQDLISWAKKAGFTHTLTPSDMHVTIAFSKDRVNWEDFDPKQDQLRVLSSMSRSLIPLGDKGAIVLKFPSKKLQNRWSQFKDGGCSWDYPDYHPHVTITYNGDKERDYGAPYGGPLIFGPEIFKEIVLDWDKKVKEV